MEFPEQTKTVHGEQTKLGTFFFAIVHFIWKELEHFEHFIGFDLVENFLMRKFSVNQIGAVLP